MVQALCWSVFTSIVTTVQWSESFLSSSDGQCIYSSRGLSCQPNWESRVTFSFSATLLKPHWTGIWQGEVNPPRQWWTFPDMQYRLNSSHHRIWIYHRRRLFSPYPGEYVWAFAYIFTKIDISFILSCRGMQQHVSLDLTKTALPYKGGLVA